MPDIVEITLDEWIEKYKPLKRQQVLAAIDSSDDSFLEEYSIIPDELDALPPDTMEKFKNRIWTYLTGEGDLIQSGKRVVNRLCYFVTLVPYPKDKIIQVDLEGE